MHAITAYTLDDVQKGKMTKRSDAVGKRDTSFEFIIYQLRRTALIQVLLLLRPTQVSSKLTLSIRQESNPGPSVQPADELQYYSSYAAP
jgi:hypothetical protein